MANSIQSLQSSLTLPFLKMQYSGLGLTRNLSHLNFASLSHNLKLCTADHHLIKDCLFLHYSLKAFPTTEFLISLLQLQLQFLLFCSLSLDLLLLRAEYELHEDFWLHSLISTVKKNRVSFIVSAINIRSNPDQQIDSWYMTTHGCHTKSCYSIPVSYMTRCSSIPM